MVRRLIADKWSLEWLHDLVIDEVEDGEQWQRWETIFGWLKFGAPKAKGERWLYKWRCDGCPRWCLILGAVRLQWGARLPRCLLA